MSFLSRLSMANRSLVALAAIAILLIGAYIIPSLKQELYPSLQFPAVTVVSVYQGASPSIVEQAVTNPVEQSIQGLQGIQQTTSYSNESTSVIIVEFNYGTDLSKAQQDLSGRLSNIQSTLPTNVTPKVQAFNLSDLPIISMAVNADENQQQLALDLKKLAVPELEGINGVATVKVNGVRDQIVNITLDPAKLKATGVSASQVTGALQANNITLPAGELTANGQTLSIRVGNTFKTIDDLANLIVGSSSSASAGAGAGLPGAGAGAGAGFPGAGAGTGTTTAPPTAVAPTFIKLGDVATVKEDLAPSSTITRTNGKESLGISITKTTDGNTVAISKDLHDKLSDIEQKLGHGAKFTVISDQAPQVQQSVDGLVNEGLIGAGFAILIILLFLFSIRSTLVTAISIPLSIMIALIGLWIGNYSLNLFTLGGLTIAVGRVIDDSIVVLENIYRHLNLGDDKKKAVYEGVREVAGAITASTLTTVAVFLPIAFTSGIVGELFKPFSVTVTIALLASLFVALTIIPVLAYWFLKAPKNVQAHNHEEHEKPSVLERIYVSILGWVLKHRAITLVVAVIFFVASMSLAGLLGTNLFDSSSSSSFTITQTLPDNSSIDTTNAAAAKVEAVLHDVSGIKFYQVNVGSSGSFLSTGSTTNKASYTVTTDDNVNTKSVQDTVTNRLKDLTDAGKLVVAASSGGFSSSNLSINVHAGDDATLAAASQQVLDEVAKVPDTTNVASNLSNAAPLIDVHVDPAKAAKFGLTAAQVGQSLRQIYSGSTSTTITLNGNQQQVDVYLGAPANTVEAMKAIPLTTVAGTIPLSTVADVTQTLGPTQITHIAGARTATITADTTSSNTGAITADVTQRLQKLHLPAGASYDLGGISSSQAETFRNLGLAILFAILLVYLIMVATFRSLVQPLILLISIPFAATGSLILMAITHTAIGAPALIGLLMLVGIVVTNAIVLIDLVHQYRDKGLDASQAVLEGGRRRLRPILMTALATILALAPMALGFDKSSGFIAGPLAIVVIGGLTTSTALTLILVPTLYTLVAGGRKKNVAVPPTPPVAEPLPIAAGQAD
ncbi:efflux RND transporter permease subunit [Tengunoibacter tsumagoiensis]|uniref:Hydrogenase expression protein n=1 Tax=Tengunoibacter tsumagoiensis TaxID=2014871 RepID=A0A401ZXB1_9CHLR|nr:efflux RND transporter permease subunit [Tengunoibacter tsumagoiensis]GCE11490.1 hydrogenase expression protein [Tengunoibacter tsumagoiensis]